jgi:hypothetical protein
MSSLVEDFVQSLQSGAPLPNQYIQSFTTLTQAIGSLENIAPPPNAGAYAGSGYVTQNLGTLKNALMAWPNSVSPDCRNTPSVIVNWDPALQANIALLQEWAAQPASPARNQEVANAIQQILVILGNSKSVIDATVTGLQTLAQAIGTNGNPVLGIYQHVETDISNLYRQIANLVAQRDAAERKTTVNQGEVNSLNGQIDMAQTSVGVARSWLQILQQARDEFGAAAPAVQYLSGIWSGLQKNLSDATAIARLVQQKPESISSFDVTNLDKTWGQLKGEMQQIASGLA